MLLKSLLSLVRPPARAPLHNRRSKVRISGALRVICHHGSLASKATVTDASASGLRLSGPSQLRPGQVVQLVQPSRDAVGRRRIRCRVVWRRQDCCGLEFQSPQEYRSSWVEWELKKASNLKRRKVRRFPCRLPVKLENHQQGDFVDIGLGGARLRLGQPLASNRVIHCRARSGRKLPLLRSLNLAARVVNVARTSDGHWDHSLCFLASPDETDVLKTYLEALAKE